MALVAQLVGLGRTSSTIQPVFAIRRRNDGNWSRLNGSTNSANGAIIKGSFKELQQLQQNSNRRRGCCRCFAGIGGGGGFHEVSEGSQFLYRGLVLGVGVGLSCQAMDCGDVVYRSTLPKQGMILTVPGFGNALVRKNTGKYRAAEVSSKKRLLGPVSTLTEFEQLTTTEEPKIFGKEAHKYFDQVVITVRAGDGGHGSVLAMPVAPPPQRRVASRDKYERTRKPEKGSTKTGALRRSSDGSLELPMGGHGGDVILMADESTETLLDLHKKKRYTAKRGGNVNASGSLTPMLKDGLPGSSLSISVPVGTVVKRKKGGKLLADLTSAGDECLVARGGQGGVCVLELPKQTRKPLRGVDPAVITDPDDKELTLGSRGEEVALELTLRVVADIGVVGLPNAGKSSLLAAVTRATPDIADYPFTTLMPNLGRLPGSSESMDGGFASGATLADLPGLIKGAHLGKGLGRMFLRHLRRTRLLLHVVDTSADDPVRDYKILREELRMYNPDYARRPHIVVLNKLDLPKAIACFEATQGTIQALGSDPVDSGVVSLDKGTTGASQLPLLSSEGTFTGSVSIGDGSPQDENLETFPRPVAVVGISAKEGLGIEELLKNINAALGRDDVKVKRKPRREARPQLYKPPQWQI